MTPTLRRSTTVPFALSLALCACTTTLSSVERPATPIEAAFAPDQDQGELRARIAELEQRLAAERRVRLDAEARVRTLDDRVRALEARVLELALERVRMEQEVLRLRVDALRAELGEVATVPAAEPTATTTPPAPRTTIDPGGEDLSKIRIPTSPRR
ncbi:MAG: hypothetical protein HZB39_05760 [Planctomycetes bacterium]|nr:hypothetical protein [Planctomycetota bacterium]